ncbi:MAG: 7-cyano-7-deazaguanine synthase [Candidatus Thorarchaeota archaeon]
MKAVCLLSGGIDSPVAAQISCLNGFQPILLHYHNYPFHSLGTLEKVVALSNKIVERNPNLPVSLVIFPNGKSQESILNNLKGMEIRQTCLLCRMQMFIKAEMYAQQIGADIIVTGEILGEQASQTLDNLPIVISKVKIPISRPLIGYNKEEVVQLSKKWGFYNLSIQPGGCCSINPRYPETKGRIDVINQIFDRIVNIIRDAALYEFKNAQIFSPPVDIEIVLKKIEI